MAEPKAKDRAASGSTNWIRPLLLTLPHLLPHFVASCLRLTRRTNDVRLEPKRRMLHVVRASVLLFFGDRFPARNASSTAEEVLLRCYREASRSQLVGHLRTVAKVARVCSDHAEIVGASKKKTLDLRQHFIEVESIDWSQNPTLWIRRLDQGKRPAGL